MRYHFIAIGGAVMHNLALDIYSQGNKVTGSDDEIFEPSRSRLANAGLLPAQTGWFPENITNDMDVIILGMHAHKDNPELKRALELNIPVLSYPEFIFSQTQNKKRIVVGGSHGKTTITSMIMHVLLKSDKRFDYLVGAQLEGFDRMVKISPKSEIAVLEGDEYLSSSIAPVPKFHLYNPNVAIISGIAWDHMNVFPTFDNYVEQFKIFINKIEKGGVLIYCEEDQILNDMVLLNKRDDIKYIPYGVPDHEIKDGSTAVLYSEKKYPLKVFGAHNLMNMEAAKYACEQCGIGSDVFYESMSDFTGAAKRLELMYRSEKSIVYKDFAHSPSKLKATIEAVRSQYPDRTIHAFVELHTYSSLNPAFLEQYDQSMKMADTAAVFYSPHTLELKKLPPINSQQVKTAFGRNDLDVIDAPDELKNQLESRNMDHSIFLMMSSGNWNGVPVFELLKERID